MSTRRNPTRHPAALALVTALAAPAAAPAAARAQLPVPGVNPLSFGVEAGPAFALGSFGNAAKSGFTGDALAELRLPLLPVGARLEAGYSQFGSKLTGIGTYRAFTGSADAVLRTSPVALTLVRPYVLGGLSVVSLNQGGGTKVGYNVGAGLSVPLAVVTVFGDVRYTHAGTTGTGFTTLPVRVGVRF
jgi:hypothetical protein